MFLKNKILALVPARGGSKGIKYKNLKKISGVSLIGHTSKFIKLSKIFDDLYLSTESKKIILEANKYNFKILHRSKKLSGDYVSDFSIINSVLRNKTIKKQKFDYLVYLQPTSPLRKVAHLKNTLRKIIKENYDAAISVTEISKKYHPKKIFNLKNGNLNLYLESGKKIFARQHLDQVFIRNGVFYIFKISAFLKNSDIYLKKTYASITNYKTFNIDSHQDLKKARKTGNFLN